MYGYSAVGTLMTNRTCSTFLCPRNHCTKSAVPLCSVDRRLSWVSDMLLEACDDFLT